MCIKISLKFGRAVFGRPFYRLSLFGTPCRLSVCHLSSVCDVLYYGETVRYSEKLSEGANRKPGSKSLFFRSLPLCYFRFRLYSHRKGCFCLIFARAAQRLVLDGTNGLFSSKPCAYCWIGRSELKPEVVLKCRKWLDMPHFASQWARLRGSACFCQIMAR